MADRKIPVFSVWKNNAILKNIFLVNAPPSFDETQTHQDNQEAKNGETHQEFEETLVVGRHPDCDIRLEHPSISRFHLRIHSKPSSSHLSLTDLSSVHGTWISGKRIEPNFITRLNEGDTLRIGGSSRVYKLHWIPLGQAYDMEHPFVPPLDFSEAPDDEEEEIIKDDKSLGLQNEDIHVVDSVSKGLESLVLRDDNELVVKEVVPEAPPLQQVNTVVVRNEDIDLDPDLEGLESLFPDENSDAFDSVSESLESLVLCDDSELVMEGGVLEAPPLHQGNTFVLRNEDIDLDPDLKGSESLHPDENFDVVHSVSEGLESLVLCDHDNELILEEAVPEALTLQQGNMMVMRNTDINLSSNLEGSESLLPDEKFDVFHSVSEGLESLVLCDDNELILEEVVPEAPPLQQGNTMVMKNEDSNLLGGSSSFFPGENSDVFVQKAPPMQNEYFEVLKNDDGHAMDSVLEGLVPLFMGENWEWVGQEEHPLVCPATEYNPLPLKHEDDDEGFVSSILEGLDTSFLNENSELLAQKFIPSAPPMPEDATFHLLPKLDPIVADGAGESETLAENIHGNENQNPLQQVVQDGVWDFWYGSVLSPSSPATNAVLSNTQNHEKQNQYPHHESKPKVLSEWNCLENVNVYNSSGKECKERELWSWSGKMGAESARSSLSDVSAFSESGNKSVRNNFHSSQPLSSVKKQFGSPLMTPEQNSASSIWSRRGKQESAPQILTSRSKGKESKSDEKNVKHDPISRALFHGVDDYEEGKEIFTPDKENFTPNTHKSMRKLAVLNEVKRSSSGKPSVSKMAAGLGIYNENGMSPITVKEKYSPKFRQLDDEDEEVFTPDKENLTPRTHKSMRKLTVSNEAKLSNSGKRSLSKMPVSLGINNENGMSPTSVKENYSPKLLRLDDEDEVFTPDKENLTPNTHKTMRKLALLTENKLSNSGKSSLLKMAGSPVNYNENGMSPASDKVNYSPKVLGERKEAGRASVDKVQSVRLKDRKVERLPFQPLVEDSSQKIISETCIPDAAMRHGDSVSCAKATSKDKCYGERIRKWNMVVDTTTLLNKESRQALQLLEGLKGTQLIIPRIVIKELDCLKRQLSFFRRNSEVSSALEWIQDCMVRTQGWIHVQNSIEEGRSVAPTPPASPYSQFSCGTATSLPFSGFGSRPELLSPTADDHVLDYALFFKRTQNDGQIVLLSNDVTLKIKAMAEGLICEEAEEFRESLVNPFSERFLWAQSSPRGQTWCCSDDIVLKEKFYPSSLKMTPKAMENVKGLKLILLHNSQYFERMTAIH